MKKKIFIVALSIILLAVSFYLQNNWIGVTKLELAFDRLPAAFDGLRIVQISDLHNKTFGPGQIRLVRILNRLKPDIIFITGDLVDSRNYNEQAALDLVKKAAEIAPLYYVTGNHEWWSGKYGRLESSLRESGVMVLRNDWREIDIKSQEIYIAGIDDPASLDGDNEQPGFVESKLQDIVSSLPRKCFKILLFHRPEELPQFSKYGIDLVFSGNAHGGQVRLPFVGGLYAPGQGFFPKYTSGVYKDKSTVMVVSRGLGNSIMPQRIFNRPEVIQVTLFCKKQV